MEIDAQDVEGLNERRTCRLQFDRLVLIAGQFPGFNLICELVNPIGLRHDFANRTPGVARVPGLGDRFGSSTQTLDQLDRSGGVIGWGPRRDHLPLKALVQETRSPAGDVDVLPEVRSELTRAKEIIRIEINILDAGIKLGCEVVT